MQLLIDHLATSLIVETELILKRNAINSIEWTNLLLQSESCNELQKKSKPPPDFQKYLQAFHIIFKGHPKYKMKYAVNKTTREGTYWIIRKMKYKNITNKSSLLEMIENSKSGVLGDDELLNFTYKGVAKDLKDLVAKGSILEIKHKFEGKQRENDRNRMITYFPTRKGKYHALLRNRPSTFGVQFYLQVCQKLVDPEKQKQEKQSKEKETSLPKKKRESYSDPNYSLPRYLELKMQWLKRTQNSTTEINQEEEKVFVCENNIDQQGNLIWTEEASRTPTNNREQSSTPIYKIRINEKFQGGKLRLAVDRMDLVKMNNLKRSEESHKIRHKTKRRSISELAKQVAVDVSRQGLEIQALKRRDRVIFKLKGNGAVYKTPSESYM